MATTIQVTGNNPAEIIRGLGAILAKQAKAVSITDKSKVALEIQALYAKDIRGKSEVLDMPLHAAEAGDTLGTVAGTLVALQALEDFEQQLVPPSLITTDFSGETGEFNQILIDRISPQDVKTLKEFGGAKSLKGTGFGHFAAFLSRAYRENDYLLGRLHAIDRLIDIVCDAAAVEPGEVDVQGIKKRAFLRVLDLEEQYLTGSKRLFARLRRSIAAIG